MLHLNYNSSSGNLVIARGAEAAGVFDATAQHAIFGALVHGEMRVFKDTQSLFWTGQHKDGVFEMRREYPLTRFELDADERDRLGAMLRSLIFYGYPTE